MITPKFKVGDEIIVKDMFGVYKIVAVRLDLLIPQYEVSYTHWGPTNTAYFNIEHTDANYVLRSESGTFTREYLDLGCVHEFTKYVGFTESYLYCTKCDKKVG